MSKKFLNAFALLDDSDDESPKVTTNVAATKSKKETAPAPARANDRKGDRPRRNNNDRNTKGGRGPRTARDGKRTYDRRSGTGRGKEIKKGGGGSRNWGSDKNDAKKAEGDVAAVLADEKNSTDNVADKTEDIKATEEEVAIVEEKEEEEEEPTMSLEEYLESKKPAGESIFGVKKEKTASDIGNEFEGKEAHVAIEEDFVVMGTGKSLRKKTGKKEVQKLDLEFRVASSNGSGDRRPRDGGGRGDRDGGGRGNRGDRDGGGRGNRGDRDGGGRGDRDGGGRGDRGDRRGGGRGDRRPRGGERRGAGGRRPGRGRGSNNSGFAFDATSFPSL